MLEVVVIEYIRKLYYVGLPAQALVLKKLSCGGQKPARRQQNFRSKHAKNVLWKKGKKTSVQVSQIHHEQVHDDYRFACFLQ